MTKTKSDIIDMIVERTGVERKYIALCMDEFINVVTDILKNKDRIEIRGLGVFKTKKRNARIARHPKTGEKVEVPERYVPAFKPSKLLKEKVEQANN